MEPELNKRARRDIDAADSSAKRGDGAAPTAAEALEPVTVWVKRMDVSGARYMEVEGVDLQQTVSKFTERWMALAKLNVDPSLFTLRLVDCGWRKPAAEEEAAAVELDPRLSLAHAGVANGASLLAYTAGMTSTAADSSLKASPAVPMVAFWQQLPHATFKGDVMRLASGTTLFGKQDMPDSMYIRADYVGLWSEVQHLFSNGWTKVVISGNAGIGKSWLGLYMAHQLLVTSGAPVLIVWEAVLSRMRILIYDGRVSIGSLDDFRTELSDPKTWYLVDESFFPGPCHVEARTVMFSSPKRENYRHFLKAPASTIRYLPVWSWEEIDACRRLLYAGDAVRTPAAVAEAYARWGGIPRFVLEKLADTSAQTELDSAFIGCDLFKLIESVGSVDSAPDTSHRILHIIASASSRYTMSSVELGSDYIKSRVAAIFLHKQRSELTAFVSRDSDPWLANLRGIFFEVLAHEKLAAGGGFRTRGLVPQTVESISS